MKDSSTGTPGAVDAVAMRLRMVQADLAGAEADLRADHLCDEVERAIEGLVPDERRVFLEELSRRFPVFESPEQGGRAAAGGGASLDEASDGALVEELVRRRERMADAQRRELGRKLTAAGFVAPGTSSVGGLPPETAERVRGVLRMSEGAVPDAGRAGELAAVLAQTCQSLDNLVWSTWKQVAPKSALRRRAPLGESMSRLVASEGEASRTEVAEDVERMRQLCAALISAVSQVGQLAFSQLNKASPEAIETAAKMEKKWHESLEVTCWRKYKEQATLADAAALEAEILKGVAEYAESLMRGVGR